MPFSFWIFLSIVYLLALSFFLEIKNKPFLRILLRIAFIPSLLLIYSGFSMIKGYDTHPSGYAGRWGFILYPVIEYWPYFLIVFGGFYSLLSYILLKRKETPRNALDQNQWNKYVSLVRNGSLYVDISELPANKALVKSFLIEQINKERDKATREMLAECWIALSRFQPNVNEMNKAKAIAESSTDLEKAATATMDWLELERPIRDQWSLEEKELIQEYAQRWAGK